MNMIFKTAFWTSVASYCFFAFGEWVRTGFVSLHFWLHWFLVAAMVFGILAVATTNQDDAQESKLFSILGCGVLSLILFIVFLSEGDMFGDFRVFVALAAAAAPWVAKRISSWQDDAYDK